MESYNADNSFYYFMRYPLPRLVSHLRIMEVNGILFVGLKRLVMKFKILSSVDASPKTMSVLLCLIYRPHSELFSFRVFSPENIVPIKLFTATSEDTNNKSLNTVTALETFFSAEAL